MYHSCSRIDSFASGDLKTACLKHFFTDIFNNEVCPTDIVFGYFQKNEELKGNNELNLPLPYSRNSTSHHFTNIFLIFLVICHFSELSSRILAHTTARVRNVRNKILRSFCINQQSSLSKDLAEVALCHSSTLPLDFSRWKNVETV